MAEKTSPGVSLIVAFDGSGDGTQFDLDLPAGTLCRPALNKAKHRQSDRFTSGEPKKEQDI